MNNRTKMEFSKVLLLQESVLIWITTLAYVVLAFYCIRNQYLGTLPWLTAGVSLPWAAYGVSQGFYYNKSKTENSKDGIKYELALKEAESLFQPPMREEFVTGTTVTSVWSTADVETEIPIDLNGPI